MTQEEASEVILHLVDSLQQYGFGDIVEDAYSALEEERTKSEKLDLDNNLFLRLYLREVINSLRRISNDGFEKIIDRFNNSLDQEKKIESVYVALAPDANELNEELFNLRDLPSYGSMISELSEILEMLDSDE